MISIIFPCGRFSAHGFQMEIATAFGLAMGRAAVFIVVLHIHEEPKAT